MNPSLLKESSREDRAHAYLICGNEELCNLEVSAFAQALICTESEDGRACGVCSSCKQFKAGTYPDYFVIEPKEKGSTKTRYFNLEEIRNVLRIAGLTLPDGKNRVIWFKQAEYFRAEQFNTLLKSLEEPEDNVIFLLSASKPDSIAPTIYSRCRLIRIEENVKGAFDNKDAGLNNIGTDVDDIGDIENIKKAAETLNRLIDADLETILTAAADFEDKDALGRFIGNCGVVLGDNYRCRLEGGTPEYCLKDSFGTDLIFALWQRALAAPELLHHPIKKEMIAEDFLLLLKRKDIIDGNCSWCTLS